MAHQTAENIANTSLTRTEHLDTYVFSPPSWIKGEKLGDEETYVPAGTKADLLVVECNKHKNCRCLPVYILQGIVKKASHSVGKPFAMTFGDPDEIPKWGFRTTRDIRLQPVSFSLLPDNNKEVANG
jgi:hypothetical protein